MKEKFDPNRMKRSLDLLNEEKPEITKLKEKILNLPGIDVGLTNDDILKMLKNERQESEPKIVHATNIQMALSSLFNKGKLPGSGAVYYANLGVIVLHTFSSSIRRTTEPLKFFPADPN